MSEGNQWQLPGRARRCNYISNISVTHVFCPFKMCLLVQVIVTNIASWGLLVMSTVMNNDSRIMVGQAQTQ